MGDGRISDHADEAGGDQSEYRYDYRDTGPEQVMIHLPSSMGFSLRPTLEIEQREVNRSGIERTRSANPGGPRPAGDPGTGLAAALIGLRCGGDG
jgi:hypothetical protein